MAQAKADARDEEIPVVMHRKNNGEWHVTIPLKDFVVIYREWERGKE